MTRAAPRVEGDRWHTPAGVLVARTTRPAGGALRAQARLEAALNRRRGLLRYHGHDRVIGYVDPPVELVVRGDRLSVNALNQRGRVLLPALRRQLWDLLDHPRDGDDAFHGVAAARVEGFCEEERTRHAGVFRAIRGLCGALAAPLDPILGLYGAFGYDLIFQVEPVELHQRRHPQDRDLVLHLPDEVLELDLRADTALVHSYEFAVDGDSTGGLARDTPDTPFAPRDPAAARDHEPGEYADLVRRAMPSFRAGDLFEVVPGQVLRRRCPAPPATLFRSLRHGNPAPHSLLMNLGEGEYLVGASPEMFVHVGWRDGRQLVRSSPISGTIARGRDAIEDARNIRVLLDSRKDESELTMCTDVDRNDKARVCEAGTVRVTGRRQIEMYSALIHTVDRVEGLLRPDRDALDGFLAHLWAVTVTGAPKIAAVEFLERHERSPRRWYGGAVGRIGFDGTLDTVLTLRTIQIHDGVAHVRVGATLLHDSDPVAEERETELKAAALLRVLDDRGAPVPSAAPRPRVGEGLRVLLVDHRDSFVHCLADYVRQTGAEVVTYRSGHHLPRLETERPDLLLLSPGPGRPSDFGLAETLAAADRLGVGVFGVCLGLQGIAEYFGGRLGLLDEPVHGKSSTVRVTGPDSPLLAGLPPAFEVGRYHSLHARADTLPADLRVTATTDDGVIMALEHRSRPLAAVQFHPESIMTAGGGAGHTVIANAVSALARRSVRR
ncbi:anthranilate synthase component I [Dactylosporangium sp. NPDC051484]|uniref:anthranilate synthase component I n=1 Tax=Dactylosporangium sp. NPDC051484 TaxID=3154942 RepID=UPI00344E5A0F